MNHQHVGNHRNHPDILKVSAEQATIVEENVTIVSPPPDTSAAQRPWIIGCFVLGALALSLLLAHVFDWTGSYVLQERCVEQQAEIATLTDSRDRLDKKCRSLEGIAEQAEAERKVDAVKISLVAWELGEAKQKLRWNASEWQAAMDKWRAEFPKSVKMRKEAERYNAAWAETFAAWAKQNGYPLPLEIAPSPPADGVWHEPVITSTGHE